MDTNLVAVLGGVALSSVANILVVIATQWGSRRAQKDQLDATAFMADKAHQNARQLELDRRSYEETKEKWRRQFEMYAEYLRRVDEIQMLGVIPGETLAEANAKFDSFSSWEKKVLLLAPVRTAHSAVILGRAAHEITSIPVGEEGERLRTNLKKAKEDFLQNARIDLGSEGDVLPLPVSATDEKNEKTLTPQPPGMPEWPRPKQNPSIRHPDGRIEYGTSSE